MPATLSWFGGVLDDDIDDGDALLYIEKVSHQPWIHGHGGLTLLMRLHGLGQRVPVAFEEKVNLPLVLLDICRDELHSHG